MSRQTRKAYTFIKPTAEPQGISEEGWKRAHAAIEKLKRSYIEEWAPTALDELERTLKMARSSPDLAAEQLQAAHRLAHDMKGQGATFGFALVSDIGGALCVLTNNRVAATSAELRAMLAHVRAARSILTRELEDPDCPEAHAVMRELKSAIRANLH